MSQRGFFSLTMIGFAGAAAVIAIMGIALKVQSGRVANYRAELEQKVAQFEGFKLEVKRLGDEQAAKVKAERERQEQVNKQTVKSYESRLASLNATYRSLRDQRGSASASPVPAVPDTARATDAAARDKQLLDLLQHADLQTARLEALQEWVRAQGNQTSR